jgi:hypothetical protein
MSYLYAKESLWLPGRKAYASDMVTPGSEHYWSY